MKFEEENKVVYCKDGSYNKIYDNNCYNNAEYSMYWKGYLIHRKHGPAIEWHNGDKEWCLNGIIYGEKEYLKIINLKNKIRVLDEI